MYNCNVLIIDDDTVTLELIQLVLEELISGKIISYSNSTEALTFINSDKIDNISLVICDWLMPDVSGLDILSELRKKSPTCPFLMLTANATKDLVVNAMRLGASDFVAKPFHSHDFITKVEDLIRNAEV
ncbi:response regulator [Paraglaciecola sp. 2405UD69-4]|uniref:response regulator n=1 Tax=Paraglaciecola sp. 2405UD69-4 TaxID=3391836 RepID=UPI0039C9D851